jgi:hypothetical protein
MTHSLLPPRGIFVPTQMIFNHELPSAVLVTWIQLRCLAWDSWVTPPLSISELAALTGIHPARLHRHVSQLQSISALSWRSVEHGKIILSFPEDPTVEPVHHMEARNLVRSSILNSENRESPDPPSYFPPQILGYLSFQEDEEELQEVFWQLENQSVSPK